MKKLVLVTMILIASLTAFGQTTVQVEKRNVTMYATFYYKDGTVLKKEIPFFKEATIGTSLKAQINMPDGQGFLSYNEEIRASLNGRKIVIKIEESTPVEVKDGTLIIEKVALEYLE